MRRIMVAGILAGWLAPGVLYAQENTTDLRQFRLGMALSALPKTGYAEFHCSNGGAVLTGGGDYAKCPADAAGRREVSFRYDDDGEHQTKVAGQPVLLSLILAGDGALQAIRMQTDPSARLFLRKRGYIFGEQVMARYGEEGWACTQVPPSGGEEPVGGLFVREHCEKSIEARHLVIDRELFRAKDKAENAFTSATSFTLSLVKAGQG